MISQDRPYLLFAIAHNVPQLAICEISERAQVTLQSIPMHGVTAVVASCPESALDANGEARSIAMFDRAIRSLHQAADILPFRFGIKITLGDLERHIAGRTELYLHQLKRIQACTEVNARWAIEGNPASRRVVPGAASGRDYLRVKHQLAQFESRLKQQVEQLAEETKRQLGALCSESQASIRTLPTFAERQKDPAQELQAPRWIAGIELLVSRISLIQVMERLNAIAFEERLPTLVSGPWAPYSFAA